MTSFDTVVFASLPTEPIPIQPPRARTAPAVLWARAHTLYTAIGATGALVAALTPLPRFEAILTGIALTNATLWTLHKIGRHA